MATRQQHKTVVGAILLVTAGLAMPEVAMANTPAADLGFNPEAVMRAVAELPMHILALLRAGLVVAALILFFLSIGSLGVRGLQQAKANTFFSDAKSLSPSQVFISMALATLLWSTAQTMGAFGVTAGALMGGGSTLIQHPLALTEGQSQSFGEAVLRSFVYNSMRLVGLVFFAKATLLWRRINEGKINAPFSQVVVIYVAAILTFSFEWTYYFLITSLAFPDVIQWLFRR